eukprot:6618392-Prymnesium_polylepis.1
MVRVCAVGRERRRSPVPRHVPRGARDAPRCRGCVSQPRGGCASRRWATSPRLLNEPARLHSDLCTLMYYIEQQPTSIRSDVDWCSPDVSLSPELKT